MLTQDISQNNIEVSNTTVENSVLKSELELSRLELEYAELKQSILETQKAIEILDSGIGEKLKQIELLAADMEQSKISFAKEQKLVARDDTPLETKKAELELLKQQVGKVSGLQSKLTNQVSHQVEKPELEALKQQVGKVSGVQSKLANQGSHPVEKPELEALKQQKGRISGLLSKLTEKNPPAVELKKAAAKPVATKFKKNPAAQLPKPEVTGNPLPVEPVDKKQESPEMKKDNVEMANKPEITELQSRLVVIQAEYVDKEAVEAAMKLMETENPQLTFQLDLQVKSIKPEINIIVEKGNGYSVTPISEEDYDKICQQRIKESEAEEERNRMAIQQALNY